MARLASDYAAESHIAIVAVRFGRHGDRDRYLQRARHFEALIIGARRLQCAYSTLGQLFSDMRVVGRFDDEYSRFHTMIACSQAPCVSISRAT